MKNKKGFTLIELLGVIVILGLVFALVIPGLIKIFKKSNKSIDEATEKLIISSAEDYLKNFELSNKYNHYCIQVINLVEEGYLDEKIESNLGNEDYYVKVNYNKGKAEYSVVDKCNPMLYNVTLSATSNKIKVVVGDEFNKNIKKYYYSLDNNSFYESESNVYTFENLNFNTEYTVYIKVLDDKNLESDVYKFKTKTNTSVNPEIAITNVPISKKNEYLKSQSFKIDYKDDGIENPIYYFKSTRKADIDVDVVESCGKNKQPSSCETIPNTKNIEENTWYKVSKNINVLYDDTSSISGELIAITGDGYNYNGYTTSNISKIDATTPELEFTSQQESYRDIYLNYEIIEEHSGLNEYTCKYGTDENSYNNYVAATNTSCHIENLSLNKKYYYEICASDNVSNKNCINGSATTKANYNPIITQHSANVTSGYTWATSKTIKIEFEGKEKIENAQYYFKSTVSATVESGVVTHSCGTGNEPNNCAASSTTTLVANTWYKTDNTKPLITYNEVGTLYALISDGVGSSSYNITNVSNGIPTTPVLAGGSDSWTNENKTITITPSTEASGIKKYQYYISTSASGQTGGSWVDLASNKTSISISTEGTRYIYLKAIGNNGIVSDISSSQTTRIDTTAPEITNPTITKSIATFTMTDNLGLSSYEVNESTTTQPSSYKNISGTSVTKDYLASKTGTFVVWAKDQAGNTSKKTFSITELYWTYSYNGSSTKNASVQTFNVPKTGKYKLEVWGASGGASFDGPRVGGLGGYSYGSVSLQKDKKLYIAVGEKGSYKGYSNLGDYIYDSTGFNGGTDNRISSTYAGGGGGATHIAITTNRGELKNYVNNTNEVLIVAGGGGGASIGTLSNNVRLGGLGGDGGGETGGTGYLFTTEAGGATGGTKSGPGVCNYCGDTKLRGGFGYGGYVTSTGQYPYQGGGGGGWYGGNAGAYKSAAGGGGSGYIGGVEDGKMQNGVREGHGYARISVISLN